MRASTSLAIAMALILTHALPRDLPAQDNAGWVRKRVVLQFGSVLRVGDQVIDNQKLEARSTGGLGNTGRIYKVEQVNGPWLWLQAEGEGEGVAGWVHAAEVIPYDQAIDYYTKQIRANPANHAAYMSRGHIWRDRKEYDLALADYNEALRLDPGSAVSWTSRGLAWRAKKQLDKAIADYTEALRLDPKSAHAYVNRGIAWNAKKEHDKAIADYAEALRLDPKSARAYNSRGNTWRAKKEHDKAIADHSEALRLDPKSAHAYVNRGIAWSAKKEHDKAIADFTEALRIDPKFPWGHFGRAVVLLATRQPGATDATRRVLQLEDGKGDLAAFAVVLGSLAARIGRDEGQAQEFLGPLAAKLDTTQWPYPIVRYLRCELDEAGLLAQATDDNKKTTAHCYLGLDLLAKGKSDQALKHLRWVKEHGNPALEAYTTALAELDRAGDGAVATH